MTLPGYRRPSGLLRRDRQRFGFRRWHRALGESGVVLVIAGCSIAAALAITPMQEVAAAGQTVQVGVTGPSLSLSGPGELDLFGEQIPTSTTFTGPVRPRLRLTNITLSQQLAEFTHPDSGASPAQSLQDALVRGWWHYFYRQMAIVAIAALILTGAVSGWLRRSWRRTAVLVAITVTITAAVNLGAIMVTAFTAPGKLSQVHSLQALVGGARPLPAPHGAATQRTGSRAVVIGDSTAAALGNRPLADPTRTDTACHRSIDSYAQDLATENAWQVTNLACSGATIADGLLAPQPVGGTDVPPQLSSAAVTRASTIIVSIGANDVRWSDILRVCAVSTNCDNRAELAYFQRHLARFSSDYLQLLSDLQVLPNHPRVLVNLYYAPFNDSDSCLARVGITASKQRAMLSSLSALNRILEDGARAASFTTAHPDFTGHGICSDEPWVQGPDAAAPFHPTAAGELAIALSDEHALQPEQ